MNIIKGYEVIGSIGEGAMAKIYKVAKNGKFFAAKVLNSTAAQDKQTVKRFKREFEIGVEMKDHSTFIEMFELQENNQNPAIIMEFVEGRTLESIMSDNELLSSRQAVAYIYELANSLEVFHSKGFVHRDLKPENIMITNEGNVKIMDYGIARDLNVSLTKTGSTVGTPIYMAPEQICGSKIVDGRCDIYSLGLILYRLLSGNDPHGISHNFEFSHLFSFRLHKPIIEIKGIEEKDISKVLKKCLLPNPRKRYSSTQEFCKALKKLNCFTDKRKDIIKTTLKFE